MKIFAGSGSIPLAEKVANLLNVSLSPIERHVFPDGEQRVRLEEGVVEQDTILIQSTGIPTDTNYIELFFTIDALKRSGAESVTVVIPYLGYQRQDHVFRSGEDRSFAVIVKILETLAVDRIITFDLHSIKLAELFHIPFVHLSALPLFAKVIKEERIIDNETVLVSPDMGGVRRATLLSEMLHIPIASIEKNRDLKTGEISAQIVHGEVKKHAIIVDDMISSGLTIVEAVKMLREHGAQKQWVFATHAVFSDSAKSGTGRYSAKQNLEGLPVEKIYVTDTLFVPEEKRFGKLEILSVAEIIAEALRKRD